MVVGEEHLEPRRPVVPPPQQPVGTLVPAHVAVPGVFLDGCLRSPWPHQEIHTLHAKAPGRKHSGAKWTLTPRPGWSVAVAAGWAGRAESPGAGQGVTAFGAGPHLQQLLFPHMSTCALASRWCSRTDSRRHRTGTRAFQEAVLGSSMEAQRPTGSTQSSASAKAGGKPSLRALALEPPHSPGDMTLPLIQSGFRPDHTSEGDAVFPPTAVDAAGRGTLTLTQRRVLPLLHTSDCDIVSTPSGGQEPGLRRGARISQRKSNSRSDT